MLHGEIAQDQKRQALFQTALVNPVLETQITSCILIGWGVADGKEWQMEWMTLRVSKTKRTTAFHSKNY